MKTIFGIICTLAIPVCIIMSFETWYTYSINNQPIEVSQLKALMRRATAFESDGNLWLREAVKAKLAKSPLTYGDYKQLDAIADKIESEAMIKMFQKDLFKYRSRGGLAVDLPPGYIDREKK